ncbi:MAG: hypothetical protein FWE71_08615 [Nocardioidaceae bacterium]|nr:hypothetical protein [Nocardioidaceae bacterium]MCL2612935.1 hypothetical protein [Nocardioidaceae bacterium]
MPIIDLTAEPPLARPTGDAVADAPRRIGLTLPELQEAARLAGGAPLPFAVAEAPSAGAMESRLGGTPAGSDDAAFRALLATLPDAADSLVRRGLVTAGALDAGVAGALGLLAKPAVAIDLDVALPGARARAWHRESSDAVATLATSDGVVFELSWYSPDAWAAELARTVTVPEEVERTGSQVPSHLDVPLGLAESVADALAAGRTDLVDVLLDAGHACTGPDGELGRADVRRALLALATESRGRLRALVARTEADDPPRSIGVVSWTLVNDGWRHLRPYRTPGGRRLAIEAAEPTDLAALLAPTLAAAR